MARVFMVASVAATWQGERIDVAPTTAEQMAAVSVRLLIEELGTEKARKLMRKEFARYKRDYKGSGRDERSPLLSD
jgi:hypothetical protein